MMRSITLLLSLALLGSCAGISTKEEIYTSDGLPWNSFSEKVFDDAKATDKLVLLHVGAQWCHWCHVMEDSTYSDLEVQKYLNAHFIMAKEDQDSRPDLFTRYRSYGWPAIIVFDKNANEILKLRGYQEKSRFLQNLKLAVENPAVLVQKTEEDIEPIRNMNSLNTDQLLQLFQSKIDFEKGSLNTFKKSLFAPSVEMALSYSNQSDSLSTWLQTSIENSYQLIDPAWGGVFQYATHHDWKKAHFERLLRVQAEHIIHYTRYGSLTDSPEAIANAEFIYEYCNEFLSLNPPLFNNSQDADYKKGVESTSYYILSDSERRNLGVPVTHSVQFLKENALMSKALVYLWASTGNEKYLVRAEKILDELRTDFKTENGLFRRSTTDSLLFSLDDNIAMLDALVLANQVSGSASFLTEAEELAKAILKSFTNERGNLNSVTGNLTLPADVTGSSNMYAAFSVFHLASVLKNDTLKSAAQQISERFLSFSTDYSAYFLPFRLLKLKYLDQEPMHAVLIFDEPGTIPEKEMVRELISLGEPNLIIERVNLKTRTEEQKLLYGSVQSGTLFLCNSAFCSSPVTEPSEIRDVLFPGNKKTTLPEQHGFSNTTIKN